MNLDYTYLLDGSFSSDSRVWIYQSSRLFTISEALEIEKMLNDFTVQWKSHGTPVKGAGYLFFGQFIILMADEKATGVSGCSTDSSVRMIRDFEQQFGLTMFDRTSLAFWVEEKIVLISLPEIQQAFDNGSITTETLYFNNLVQTKAEFEKNWITPLKSSWLATRIRTAPQI